VSALAMLAVLLPGLAWWAWLGSREQDPLVSLAQIFGASLAVNALLAEGLFLLGIRLNLAGLLAILGAFMGLAIFGLIRRPYHFKKKYRFHLIIGLALLGLTVAWRLYQARGLSLPPWVDSQHHFLILRVILEQGGLPETLAPYLPMPFYYHYGFHASAALFASLSRLPLGRAMLVYGQVLNAGISLSLYALGKALWQDWRPAAAGALLVGFATRMPAYYLSWGRYTLTAGLVLLPLAMGLAMHLLQSTHTRKNTLTLGLIAAGLLLSHYFAAFLLALFLVLLALVYLVPRWDRPLTALLRIAPVVLAAGLGLLLAGPWLLRVAEFSPASTRVSISLPGSMATLLEGERWNYLWSLLSPPSNHWLLLPAGAGLILGLAQKKRACFATWSLAIVVLMLPLGQGLGPFRPDHFAIVSFLPVAVWAAWLFWQVGCWLGKRLGLDWLKLALPTILVCAWIAWGLPLSANIVNPVTTFATPADLRALDWVEAHTPEDAHFFINTAYWLNDTYRGVDGGGWLLPYTSRWSLVPTVFYTFSPEADYRREMRGWGERAAEIRSCTDDFWQLVGEANLDHVYIREGVGGLQPESLIGCAGVNPIYRNEKVWIYQITGD